MNYFPLAHCLLLLSLASCSVVKPQGNHSANSAVSTASPTVRSSAEITSSSDRLAQAQPTDASDAPAQRDYAPTAPIPETGQVTVRNSIRTLEPTQMLDACPPDSAPYAYAESTNHRVQICSAEYDPWLPKYFIADPQDGSSEIRITNDDPDTARQLLFSDGDRTYSLAPATERSADTNLYLEIRSADGSRQAEALLYFYEQSDRPAP